MHFSTQVLTLVSTFAFGVTAVPWRDITSQQNIKLTETPYTGLIKALDGALPVVTVAGVIRDVNHDMSVVAGNYKWPSDSSFNDFGTEKWMPQGITTSADALDDGMYGANKIMLTSWYAKESPEKGVRISFINVGVSPPKYRHVLLVEPSGSASTPDFKSVEVHAGGIAWYGNLLYVVDTGGGLRVFDMNHIYRVATGGGIGKQSDGSYQAYNYKYVLPQARKYNSLSRPSSQPFTYSYISLDRTTTPDSFIVGEYNSTDRGARVARFDLDYKTRLPKTTSGVATASEAYLFGYYRIQGMASIAGRYYLTQSNGVSDADRGDLFTYTPGQESPKEYEGHFPAGPEDLSYDKTTGTLWTLTEHPNNRYIVGTKVKDFP